MKRALILLFLSCSCAGPVFAQTTAPEQKKNWFDDPFFQVSSGLAACPVPEGPLVTQHEAQVEEHYRVERGTSCWLHGQCKYPNSYLYDKPLAAPVAAALAAVPGVQGSSVWVTLQRRWVFLQGCVTTPEQIQALEQAAQAVPDVEIVVPQLMVGTTGKPRYDVRQP
ncbi:MAG: BON domain-containing protein [Rhodoferax sp.]